MGHDALWNGLQRFENEDFFIPSLSEATVTHPEISPLIRSLEEMCMYVSPVGPVRARGT